MAWIYLQESEESPWPWSPGSGPSPIVKTTDMLNLFCYHGCRTGLCHWLPFGTMCERCAKKCYRKLISSTEVSPAKTLALQELVKAWKESEADYSLKLSGLQASLTRRLCSLKTCQQLELGDFEKSLEHLPISGMTVDGRVYLPLRLEPRTLERDGFCLPTPVANDTNRNPKAFMAKMKRENRTKIFSLQAYVKMFPTPTANHYGTSNNGCPGDGRKNYKQKGKLSLASMAKHNLWPTPTVCGNYQNKKQGNAHLIGLATAVKKWPTPTASMVTIGDMEQARYAGSYPKRIKYKDANRESIGGALNPQWVEWLMGYPKEWTGLSAWVMPWFRCKRKRPLKD